MADEQDAKTLLAEALFSDPQTRPYLEDAIVKKWGDKGAAQIPGYNARKELEKEIAETRKLREKWEAEETERRARKEAEEEWAAARIRFDLTDADKPDVEKIMAERKTANYEDAAEKLALARRAAIAPPRSDARTMQVPGVKGAGGDWFKGIVEDPETWARQAADQVLADFAAGKGAKHL